MAKFIINGLNAINELTENIDMKKTNEKVIQEQLPDNIDTSLSEIRNNSNVADDFFQFLRKNEKPLQNIKIYLIFPEKQQTLKEHIDSYFSNIQKKYKEDKMFYFYFQLVLIEKFLKQYNKEIPRADLKMGLKEILKNDCRKHKLMLSKCLGNLPDDSVVVMSEFSNKINNGCAIERANLENCVSCSLNNRTKRR